MLGLVVLGLLVAAGCGGGDDSTSSGEPTPADAPPEPAPEPEPTPEPAPEPSPSEEPAEEPAPVPAPSSEALPITATLGDGWTATTIGQGIKPAIALDSAGSPAIAWLFEAFEGGFVKFAAASEGWQEESIEEGYFYGPLDLAFDPEDTPNVVWHDHEDVEINPNVGNLRHAVRVDGEWDRGPVRDPGHDGWDSTIAIGTDGSVHAAGIDPSQFNSTDGVEYYTLTDDGWRARPIGSGPIVYEFNVGLALDANNVPGISYYNDRDGDLEFARLVDSEWKIESVVSEGDAGKFSSLAFDQDGNPHISFFQQTAEGAGNVRYAAFDGSQWTVEDVAPLENVVTGQIGARRNTALALDTGGSPHIAFTDQSGLWYAVRSEGGWEIGEVLAAADAPLGQLVSLKLDQQDAPHIATYEVTATSPLDGVVVYITPS